MEKVKLIVLGLSASPAGNNAYALILKEAEGDRRLPIIIGAFEAQAIALEMEGVMPPRPLTHDLIKKMIDSFDSYLTEVHINDLKDGTFYAKLIFDDKNIEIDARPSDAVAIAVRCNAPIYVNEDILLETGLTAQSNNSELSDDDNLKFATDDVLKKQTGSNEPKTKIERLQAQLEKAIRAEDYEKAAYLRDEIKNILRST
ncbi:MAG: DUF151 domain-containing protein [Candidatus Kapabacteria bacterium]|jgi:bifunctional DNase/RNase|nr:DUF151 domain-containing protein [Candidatus Kapabacteria bacterium]